MDRDRLFWSVVGAVGLATVLLTTYSCWSPSLASATDERARDARPQRTARLKATGRAPAAKERAARPTVSTSAPPRAAPATAGRRQDREAVRARLNEYVRALRERNAHGSSSRPSQVVDAGGMPSMEMDWEQYRAWVKVADALAKRDYRATARLLGESRDALGEDLADASMDGLVDDYQQYLQEIIDNECEGQEAQSVWRKTMYMALLLAKHERLSPPLDRAGEEARQACGF